MSEEEVLSLEEEEEEAGQTAEEEEEEAEIDIDVNAALLEAMVKRTEILEKLARGEYDINRALKDLEAIAVPTSRRRRRRS